MFWILYGIPRYIKKFIIRAFLLQTFKKEVARIFFSRLPISISFDHEIYEKIFNFFNMHKHAHDKLTNNTPTIFNDSFRDRNEVL